MPVKADEQTRADALRKINLSEFVWKGFFADPSVPTRKESVFATPTYRAVFLNMYASELAGARVDKTQLHDWFPEKHPKTMKNRLDEAVELGLIIVRGGGKAKNGKLKEPSNPEPVSYELGPEIRKHLNLYIDFIDNKVELSDEGIARLLSFR